MALGDPAMKNPWCIHPIQDTAPVQGNGGRTGKPNIAVDPEDFRPTEIATLLGEPTRAREQLGWEPKTDFEELVREMVREGIKTAERDSLCEREGFKTFNYHE